MKTSRSSNMELLRICAMLMIVAYHIYTHCISCQLTVEQNRCAMACQGCGAGLFLLKSSGITFHNPLLLSYHTKQLN